MMKFGYAVVCCRLLPCFVAAQTFATWNKAELKLNNGVVERTIKLPATKGNFITSSYKPVTGAFKYFTTASTDFQFEAGNKVYSGRDNWVLEKIENFSDTRAGDGAAVTLVSDDEKVAVTI